MILSAFKKIFSIFKKESSKKESAYEKWWRIMNIPLMDISQNDLEWAANQDQFNSYASKNGFMQEIERRKTL